MKNNPIWSIMSLSKDNPKIVQNDVLTVSRQTSVMPRRRYIQSWTKLNIFYFLIVLTNMSECK